MAAGRSGQSVTAKTCGQAWREGFGASPRSGSIMVRPSDVHEALQRSTVPLGAGALAEALGSHWGTVAEMLINLERQGTIVRQGHGWVVARPAPPPGSPSFDAPLGAAPSGSPSARPTF